MTKSGPASGPDSRRQRPKVQIRRTRAGFRSGDVLVCHRCANDARAAPSAVQSHNRPGVKKTRLAVQKRSVSAALRCSKSWLRLE